MTKPLPPLLVQNHHTRHVPQSRESVTPPLTPGCAAPRRCASLPLVRTLVAICLVAASCVVAGCADLFGIDWSTSGAGEPGGASTVAAGGAGAGGAGAAGLGGSGGSGGAGGPCPPSTFVDTTGGVTLTSAASNESVRVLAGTLAPSATVGSLGADIEESSFFVVFDALTNELRDVVILRVVSFTGFAPYVYIEDVAVSGSDVFVVGSFRGTLDLPTDLTADGTDADAFVARFSLVDGGWSPVWERRVFSQNGTTQGDDALYTVAIDPSPTPTLVAMGRCGERDLQIPLQGTLSSNAETAIADPRWSCGVRLDLEGGAAVAPQPSVPVQLADAAITLGRPGDELQLLRLGKTNMGGATGTGWASTAASSSASRASTASPTPSRCPRFAARCSPVPPRRPSSPSPSPRSVRSSAGPPRSASPPRRPRPSSSATSPPAPAATPS